MKPILEIKGIGKRYKIQHLSGGYLSFRERVLSLVKFQQPKLEEFWALRDVSFDINAGESIGIIGKNGAGKSTLLKILSKITPPSKGKIISRGRVASLLEVGTGFHPELTGKENIFFNGSLLGMKRSEITSKFGEIVDFSGVEKFLDTPLKHYSTGMQLRLAFAVAAFLEPEILIIDEVLAVGDAQFQKKCLTKMEDVSKSGRTVLFVSHNMAAVKSLCKRAILLETGKIKYAGQVDDVITNYILTDLQTVNSIEWDQDRPGNENVKLKYFKLRATKGDELSVESGINVELSFLNFKPNVNLSVGIFFYTVDNVFLFEAGYVLSENCNSRTGNYIIKTQIPPFLLNSGMYKINLVFGENQKYLLYSYVDKISFELRETLFDRGKNLDRVKGLIRPICLFEEKFVNEIS